MAGTAVVAVVGYRSVVAEAITDERVEGIQPITCMHKITAATRQ